MLGSEPAGRESPSLRANKCLPPSSPTLRRERKRSSDPPREGWNVCASVDLARSTESSKTGIAAFGAARVKTPSCEHVVSPRVQGRTRSSAFITGLWHLRCRAPTRGVSTREAITQERRRATPPAPNRVASFDPCTTVARQSTHL
jgi:hypothetical protein